MFDIPNFRYHGTSSPSEVNLDDASKFPTRKPLFDARLWAIGLSLTYADVVSYSRVEPKSHYISSVSL